MSIKEDAEQLVMFEGAEPEMQVGIEQTPKGEIGAEAAAEEDPVEEAPRRRGRRVRIAVEAPDAEPGPVAAVVDQQPTMAPPEPPRFPSRTEVEIEAGRRTLARRAGQ